MILENFLNPQNPVRCVITEPRKCGKSFILTISFLNISKEFDNIYNYSPSLHQDFYQKFIKCVSSYLPTNIKANI